MQRYQTTGTKHMYVQLSYYKPNYQPTKYSLSAT